MIIIRALLPMKNDCDTSIVLQRALINELLWRLTLDAGIRSFPELSGDDLCFGPLRTLKEEDICVNSWLFNGFYVIPCINVRSSCHVLSVCYCIVRISQQQSDPDNFTHSAFVLLPYVVKWRDCLNWILAFMYFDPRWHQSLTDSSLALTPASLRANNLYQM